MAWNLNLFAWGLMLAACGFLSLALETCLRLVACGLLLQLGLVLLSEPGHLFPVFGAVVCHAAFGSRCQNFLSLVITALRTTSPSNASAKVLLPASSSRMWMETLARSLLYVFELPTLISIVTQSLLPKLLSFL